MQDEFLPSDNAFSFVLSDKSPKILFIPAGYANGIKSLEENTNIIIFSTTTLDGSLNDDFRFPFDHWNLWQTNFR